MNKTSRETVLADYAAGPQAAVDGLVMEHTAVSLNPAQGLIGGRRLGELLRSRSPQHPALVMLEAQLDGRDWAIYEVRRVLRPAEATLLGWPTSPARYGFWRPEPGTP
jgi:hypothetical protein